MTTARLSTKGQIVIPRDLREALGLRAGDDLEVVRRGDAILLRPVRTRPSATTLDQVAGLLHRPGALPLSIEEMDARLAADIADTWGDR